MDEDGLFELVKTKPGKKITYEAPSADKKPRKKLKADAVETAERFSQEKEESSQMSEQSTSSPLTQTPSASPTVKGLSVSLLYLPLEIFSEGGLTTFIFVWCLHVTVTW